MNLKTKTRQIDIEELNDYIIQSIQDTKGKNILKLDLRKLDEAPTDFFIICEGNSDTQVKAIANNIEKFVIEKMGERPSHTEGTQQGKWVLVDYFNTVVHVFYRETREFYQLEDLWSDAIFTEYQNL